MMGDLAVYQNETYTGKCYWTEKRSHVSSVFTYDDDYLHGSANWNIDTLLTLTSGAQPRDNGLPGVFKDASPDRWGQTLIRHRHLRDNKKSGTMPRTLNEVDYLLGVSDFSRQGNLRFALKKGAVFQHPSDMPPKLVALPKLLNAAHLYSSKHDDNAIAYLIDAGSASLGGARPKAAIVDGNDLYIAKFPHKQDKWDVIAWEWVCLNVAAEAGITVPDNRLLKVDNQQVLLTKRFDRAGQNERLGYISAMTLLGLSDGDQADYYEIAQKLREVSICPKEDLHELYRRITLYLLINNTDDHLRNHGLLRSGSGWRLSPAFDININPEPAASRVTSVFAEFERNAALVALKANADEFELTNQKTDVITAAVTSAVSHCGKYAEIAGIKKHELKMMLESIGLQV